MNLSFLQTPLGTVITFIVGVALGGFFSWLWSWYYYKKSKKDSAALKRIDGGLKGFEDRICELVKDAKQSVQLCLATPLLHSWRLEWAPFDAATLDSKGRGNHSYWPNEFCVPFSTQLGDAAAVGTQKKLTLEIAYLQENSLSKFAAEIPNIAIPSGTYEGSLQYFLREIRAKADLFECRVPEIPFYLAIIDGKKEGTEIPKNARGVIAFISSSQLSSLRRAGKSADEIAASVTAYEFSNSTVIEFFSYQFEELVLKRDNHLIDFLKKCATNGHKWALVNAVLDHTAANAVTTP